MMTIRVTTTKVRLVQCPKCRQVLPELVNFPLYKCGSCGTILLAKKRKSDPKNRKSDPLQTNAVDLVVEDKESNSSNKEIFTSLGECSLDQNNKRDQKQSGDCISEQLGGINLSNEDQNDERNQSQSEDCYGEQLGGVNLSHNYQSSDIDKIESCDNSDPGSLIREGTSASLVEDSFLPSTRPESSGRIWNGTNTIPDFTKELAILSLFPTDKSGIDANSKSKETPPRFNHYSNSIVSLFPPATSPNSSENDEITISNPSIPSSFPQVYPPPNGQAALSIPLHFPPTMSDTSSESNRTFNGKTNLSNPLLFPAYQSETETDDSTSSESKETFRTITSRQMVVQGSHLLPLLKQMMPQAQMSCNMQQAQAVQTTNATSSASYASGYSLQRNLRLQQQQQQRRQRQRQQQRRQQLAAAAAEAAAAAAAEAAAAAAAEAAAAAATAAAAAAAAAASAAAAAAAAASAAAAVAGDSNP